MSVPALWVGLLYDPIALNRADALADRYSFDEVRAPSSTCLESGLRARIGSCSVQALADSLLAIAHSGLLSRSYPPAARQDETQYLETLRRQVNYGERPADRRRRRLLALDENTPGSIIEATRIAYFCALPCIPKRPSVQRSSLTNTRSGEPDALALLHCRVWLDGYRGND